MYSYTYNGVTYTAKNLVDLQLKLEEAGFKGDVIKFFNLTALEELEKEQEVLDLLEDNSFEEEMQIANENLDVEIYDEKDRH